MKPTRVAVCVSTLQRPEGLRRLLLGLDALTFGDEPPDVEVIVVDNDSAASASPVCDEIRREITWPLRYEMEPRRGIPFARNKAVACALDNADFVAFIDDDEVPDPGWLNELLRVQDLTGADVVTGPVLAHFPEAVPQWVEKGGFFQSPRHSTGRRMTEAYTGNVLVRSDVFRVMGDCFDERLALTGGTDSRFFRRVHKAGFVIVWADDALAFEWIPRSRARCSWLIKRLYRCGVTGGLTAIDLGTPFWTRLVAAAKAGAWIAIGTLLLLGGILRGRHVVVRGAQYVAYGLGLAVSVVGIPYHEYTTIHGR